MPRLPMGAMLLVLCTADAAALAEWGPTWSELAGYRYSRTTINRAPAIIKSVDGRHYTDRITKIEPGERTIVVQSLPRKGFQGSDKTLQLAIEPCKRYYINAQFASSVGPDWKPVIDYVDMVPGCKAAATG
jgi:hypothetical protein